jgi:hypothetical protein
MKPMSVLSVLQTILADLPAGLQLTEGLLTLIESFVGLFSGAGALTAGMPAATPEAQQVFLKSLVAYVKEK